MMPPARPVAHAGPHINLPLRGMQAVALLSPPSVLLATSCQQSHVLLDPHARTVVNGRTRFGQLGPVSLAACMSRGCTSCCGRSASAR